MIKLSELSMDTMLTIQPCHGDFRVMNKADFLQSAFFLDGPDDPVGGVSSITVATRDVAKFRLGAILERIYEDEYCYDGWLEDVFNALCDKPETKAFLALVQKTFEESPTYREGESVEIDMEPEQAPEASDYLFRRVRGGDAIGRCISELSEEDVADILAEIHSIMQVRKTGKPGLGIYDPFLDAVFSVASETIPSGCVKFSLLAGLDDDQLNEVRHVLLNNCKKK